MKEIKALITIHSKYGSIREALEPQLTFKYETLEEALRIYEEISNLLWKSDYEIEAVLHDLSLSFEENRAQDILQKSIDHWQLDEEDDELED